MIQQVEYFLCKTYGAPDPVAVIATEIYADSTPICRGRACKKSFMQCRTLISFSFLQLCSATFYGCTQIRSRPNRNTNSGAYPKGAAPAARSYACGLVPPKVEERPLTRTPQGRPAQAASNILAPATSLKICGSSHLITLAARAGWPCGKSARPNKRNRPARTGRRGVGKGTVPHKPGGGT